MDMVCNCLYGNSSGGGYRCNCTVLPVVASFARFRFPDFRL